MLLLFRKRLKSNKVFKNYISLLLIQGTNLILPLITFPYLVRVLESEKFGLVMIAQSLMKFLIIIVDFGFNISATREVALLKNDKNKLSEFYWSIVCIKSVLLIISFLMLLGLTMSVNKLNLDPLVYLFSFGLVFGQGIFPAWFFQGIEKMQLITIVNVISKVFFTISIFFIILSPEDYILVPVLNGIGFIVAGLFGFIYSLRYVKFIVPKLQTIKNNVKSSFSLFISNFAVSFYSSSNTIILGFFIGDAIAGVYASMEKLILAIQSAYIPIYQALFPNLSTKNNVEIRKVIQRIKIPIAISGLCISLVIFFGAETILKVVFKDDLITSYYKILQILGIIALFSSLNMLYVTLFFPSVKRYQTRMKILIFGGLFNVALALSLVKEFSIYGIAISAVSTELFLVMLSSYFYKKKTNV